MLIFLATLSLVEPNNVSAVVETTVDRGPFAASINPNTDKVYVSNLFSDTVSVIDGTPGSPTENQVINTIPVTEPDKSAVNPITNKIYVISENNVLVINGTTDSVITLIPFVGVAPNSVSINPITNMIYISNRITDDVAVIDGSTDAAITKVVVGDTPVAVSVNPLTNLIYVANNADLSVSVINGSTNTVIETIPINRVGSVGHGPFALILNENDDILYVVNCHVGRFPGIVSVVDLKASSPTKNSVIDNIPVEAPGAGSFDPASDRLFIPTQAGGMVAVIDTTINEVVAEMPGGDFPIAATLDQINKKLYVLDFKTTLDFPFIPPTEDGIVTVLNLDDLPPVADAGPDQIVDEDTIISLDGTGGFDSNGDILTYSWEQIIGPAVILSANDIPNPTFISPLVDPQNVLTFELTVSDGTFMVKDSVNILVKDVTIFKVSLVKDQKGVTGNVDVGDVVAGTPFTLEYATPDGLSTGGLTNTKIITETDGTDVKFDFEVFSGPPIRFGNFFYALNFEINGEGIDFSDPGTYPNDNLPKTQFMLTKGKQFVDKFNDDCPVVTLFLFNEITGKFETQGNPVVPNTNKLFVANFGSNTVSIIDGSTNTISQNIVVEKEPFEIVFDPNTNTVYVTNAGSNIISVIDAGTMLVVDTIDVGNAPIALALNSVTSTLYVANQGSNTISVIDPITKTIVETIDVGSRPVGFGINQVTNTIYVANQASDTVSVIDGDSNSLTDTLDVGDAPSAIVVNPNTNTVYVANRGSDSVSVIDGANNVLTNIPVGNFPISLTINQNDNQVLVYTANLFSDSISVIDGLLGSPTENQLISNVDVGDGPSSIVVNPNIGRVYVINNQDNSVSVIDEFTNKVIGIIPVQDSPVGIAINPEVPNPVRDPAMDKTITNEGITECAYLADKPHLSRFAIGGVSTGLSIGGVSLFGGSGGDNSAPTISNPTILKLGSPEDGFGGIISESNLREGETRVIKTGEKLTLRFDVHENQGIDNILHVSLYMNEKGHYNLLNDQTYVRYEKHKGIQVIDKESIFSKVDFDILEIDNTNSVLKFDFIFEKPMKVSDILLRMWDGNRNQQDYLFADAIEVINASEKILGSTEILKESEEKIQEVNDQEIDPEPLLSMEVVEGWVGYSGIKVSDSELLSHIEIEGSEIPNWFKKSKASRWLLEEKITQQDFVNCLKFFEKMGFLI